MTTSVKYEVEQLYHYTSLNTLHAILQNKTIRLTDYRFLNDMQELFFATEKLKKFKKFQKELKLTRSYLGRGN